MRAEFMRLDEPEKPVGVAEWTGSGVRIEAEDPKVRRALARAYRQTPVLVDDPALRSFGTSGPESLAPGSLRWFMACTRSRSPAEKLSFRLIPAADRRPGWDPAGAYRTFADQVERTERLASAADRSRVPPEPA